MTAAVARRRSARARERRDGRIKDQSSCNCCIGPADVLSTAFDEVTLYMTCLVSNPTRRRFPCDYRILILILRSRSISSTLFHTSLSNVAPGYDNANNLPILIQFLRSASPTAIFSPLGAVPSPSLRSLMNSVCMNSATSAGMTSSREAARACARYEAMPVVSCSADEGAEAGSRPIRGICRSTYKASERLVSNSHLHMFSTYR